jgi:glycosyltransferase involved in cell wall biosynthesis
MKKNVCMIVYTDYCADTRVRREAETLAAMSQHNVIVLALKESALPHTYDIDGVKVIEVTESKYCGKNKFRYVCSYIKFTALSFFVCTKLFVLRQVDIVHVHNMPDFLVFAGLVPRLLGKKLILDVHDSVPETYMVKFNASRPLLFKFLCLEESLSCALAHEIICVNHVQRDVLVKRGIPLEKMHICMNVPDHKRFNSKNTKKTGNRDHSGFRMVYHGTIVKRLGIDLAIEAVARLINEIPDLEFHIWGKSGDDLDEFVALSEELGVQDRVYFLSKGVPLENLPSRLSGMDLGVVGNRKNIATELMLPVKMLEYIALDIPVVVPRLKGIEYYFSDEMVSYYEPENVDSMAGAVLRLYKDRSMRKKQAEKAKAFLDQYGWEKHRMGLINLYKEL